MPLMRPSKSSRSAVTVLLFVGAVGLCALAAGARWSMAQDGPQVPTFRSSTTLIEVDAIVKDAAGRFVAGLSATDFELLEDGVRQSIDAFYLVEGDSGQPGSGAAAAGAPMPRVSGPAPRDAIQRVFILVFDEDHMAVGSVVRAKQAAAAFLATTLQPGDVGGVVAGGTLLGHRLTSVRTDLEAAVQTVRPSDEVRSRDLALREWPRFVSLYEAFQVDHGDTHLLDRLALRACNDDTDQCAGEGGLEGVRQRLVIKGQSIVTEARRSAANTLATLDALVGRLAPVPGRKTVVYLSDGFFSENLAGQMQAVLGRASRANVRIYVVDTRGLDRGSAGGLMLDAPNPDAADVPHFDLNADGPNSLAVDTGGLMLHNENDLAKALREVARDTSSYYVLGYRPTRPALDGGFRSLKVRVLRSGLTVRARRGYLASPLAATPPAPVEAPNAVSSAPAPLATTVVAPRYVAALPTADGLPVADAGVTRMRPAGLDATDLQTAGSSPRTPVSAGLARQLDDGWTAYQRGDTGTARAALAPVCADPAAPPWAHYVLGWATFADGDFTTAATEWRHVQQAVPEFKPVYFDLADSFLRRQDGPHALEVLRDAAHRWPTDLEILNALGVVNTALGAFGDAIATYRKALSVSAGDLTTTFNLARTSEISYVTSLRQGVEHDRDRKEATTSYRAAARDTGSLGALARDGLYRLTAIEVPHLQCAAPVTVASLPRAAIPAPPTRLAWDPEGRRVYLGVAATRKSPAAHLLVSMADGQVTTVQAEPDWAARYWSWKAAESAPWLPSRRMVAETRQTRAVQGVVTPMTGLDPTLDAVRSVSPLSTVLTLSGDAVTETSGDHPFSGAKYLVVALGPGGPGVRRREGPRGDRRREWAEARGSADGRCPLAGLVRGWAADRLPPGRGRGLRAEDHRRALVAPYAPTPVSARTRPWPEGDRPP